MAQDFIPEHVVPKTATADTTQAAVNVTTSSTTIVSAKTDRRWLYLVNDSDTTIYLSFGGTATLNQGIRLNANGGTLTINASNLYTGAITGIHGGTGNKAVTYIQS